MVQTRSSRARTTHASPRHLASALLSSHHRAPCLAAFPGTAHAALFMTPRITGHQELAQTAAGSSTPICNSRIFTTTSSISPLSSRRITTLKTKPTGRPGARCPLHSPTASISYGTGTPATPFLSLRMHRARRGVINKLTPAGPLEATSLRHLQASAVSESYSPSAHITIFLLLTAFLECRHPNVPALLWALGKTGNLGLGWVR